MNNNQPLISVIIPVYKVEAYLPACIDSVFAQTYPNLEIILVDDGSPDRCGEICDTYAEKDCRIRVIHKKNGGLSDARNAGMGVAAGEYFYFLDSDDYIHPEAISILLKHALAHHADIVCADYLSFLDGTEPQPALSEEKPVVLNRIAALERFVMKDWGAWGKLYRREIHEGIEFPFGKIHEDEAIMLQLLDRCDTIVTVEDQLYLYRTRPGSITAQSYSLKKMDWMNGWIANVDYAKRCYPMVYRQCLSKAWMVAMYNIGHLLGKPEYRPHLDIITAFLKTHFLQILTNPHISASAKLRALICRISRIHKKNCLYGCFYGAVDKARGKSNG